VRPQTRDLVERLRLQPHPEGGFYRETFRSPLVLSGLSHGGARPASTAIYFLLPASHFSAFHRVASEEAWHHYDGDPVLLHLLDDVLGYRLLRLGTGWGRGEEPQVVVPAGCWQAAEPEGDLHALCGCTVAPGFDFADFEMAPRAALARRFPAHLDVVNRLTRAA
jgi:hypothetical protein